MNLDNAVDVLTKNLNVYTDRNGAIPLGIVVAGRPYDPRRGGLLQCVVTHEDGTVTTFDSDANPDVFDLRTKTRVRGVYLPVVNLRLGAEGLALGAYTVNFIVTDTRQLVDDYAMELSPVGEIEFGDSGGNGYWWNDSDDGDPTVEIVEDAGELGGNALRLGELTSGARAVNLDRKPAQPGYRINTRARIRVSADWTSELRLVAHCYRSNGAGIGRESIVIATPDVDEWVTVSGQLQVTLANTAAIRCGFSAAIGDGSILIDSCRMFVQAGDELPNLIVFPEFVVEVKDGNV